MQRFAATELFAQRHEARHFGFGDFDLFASEISETNVGNLVVFSHGRQIAKTVRVCKRCVATSFEADYCLGVWTRACTSS